MSKASDVPFSRVEVITSVQRRRRWSVAEKVRVSEEAMQPGMSVSSVARHAGISLSQLFPWKRRMLEGGHAAVAADEDVVAASKVRQLEKRGRDLERRLGRKTMENEIRKVAIAVARPKKQSLPLVSWTDPADGSRCAPLPETVEVTGSGWVMPGAVLHH